MARMVLRAAAVTVEYDTVRGQDAVAVLPFPHPGDDDGALFVGTLAELRGLVDSMAGLVDDLEASE